MLRAALLWFGMLLAASPAWAMRAHDYLDEQRASVTLPGDRAGALLTVQPEPEPGPPASAAEADATRLPPREQRARAAAPVTSPVPEPSATAMLGLGLLLLFLKSHRNDDDNLVRDPDRDCTL